MNTLWTWGRTTHKSIMGVDVAIHLKERDRLTEPLYRVVIWHVVIRGEEYAVSRELDKHETWAEAAEDAEKVAASSILKLGLEAS